MAYLNSLNFSSQLIAVKNIMETAQVKTTFWGSRVVEVKGFTGAVYLDVIARKVIEAANQRCEADNLGIAERMAGLEIVKKLKEFYRTSDAQIANSCCLTRFLNWIREFSVLPYTARFYIETNVENTFRAYSHLSFLRQFHGTFENGFDHPSSDGSFGPPLRIVAKESEIQRLFNLERALSRYFGEEVSL